MTGPLEIVGGEEAPRCIDGVCTVPSPSTATATATDDDHARGWRR